VEAVHSVDYIRRFEEVCFSGQRIMDSPDNRMCTETFETALLAVGGVLKTVDLVMQNEIDIHKLLNYNYRQAVKNLA
jgi:acetoin utilization deacetylase AcuC-like enzyme